jgi:glutamate 5-kinase
MSLHMARFVSCISHSLIHSLFSQVLTPLQTDSTSSLSHDVTGGIASKIQTAIDIVKETGVEIFLVQVGTPHAARALAGDVTGESEADYRRREDWKGTRISLWKSKELEETGRSLAVLETPSRTSMTE